MFARLGDHPTPVRRRRGKTEPQEPQSADRKDRIPHAQHRVDDDRPTSVWQDLEKHDVERVLTPRLGRPDVIPGPDIKRQTAYQASDTRRADKGDGDHHIEG